MSQQIIWILSQKYYYPGIVSKVQYFSFPTIGYYLCQLMIINKGKVDFFEGSYSEYVEEKQKNTGELNSKKNKSIELNNKEKTKGINIYKVNKRLEELEVLIEKTEKIIAESNKLLSEPELYKDFQKYDEVITTLKLNQILSEEYMEEWADLQSKIEDQKGEK